MSTQERVEQGGPPITIDLTDGQPPGIVATPATQAGLALLAASCGSAYVPRYSTIARCVLGVAMILLPALVGLIAGAHSGWDVPLAWGMPWTVMLIAVIWGPVALRPPRDPIAQLVDDVRTGHYNLDDAMRLIGVIHERRSYPR